MTLERQHSKFTSPVTFQHSVPRKRGGTRPPPPLKRHDKVLWAPDPIMTPAPRPPLLPEIQSQMRGEHRAVQMWSNARDRYWDDACDHFSEFGSALPHASDSCALHAIRLMQAATAEKPSTPPPAISAPKSAYRRRHTGVDKNLSEFCTAAATAFLTVHVIGDAAQTPPREPITPTNRPR